MAEKEKHNGDVSLLAESTSSVKLSFNRKRGLDLIILILAFLVAVAVIVFIVFWNSSEDCAGVLHFQYASRHVYLSNPNNEKFSYFGQMGKNLAWGTPKRRPVEKGFEYSWENGVSLLIKAQNTSCTSVNWHNLTRNIDKTYPVDCFVLKDKNWYGGGELYNQVWPLEGAGVEFAPYYPQDIIRAYYDHNPAFGPVLGRYWITSSGTAILVDQDVPLAVGINAKNHEGFLCLTIAPDKYPDGLPLKLNYAICKDKNVKTVHQAMLSRFIKTPSKGPDEKMMRDPIWSTWVRYSKGVTQNDVEQFLTEIVANNFSCSQIEIDDMYSTTYGDYDFDPVKFPNPMDMIDKIHQSGCRVTTWVHPFANVNSKAFSEGVSNNYFVVGPDGKTTELIFWWNGVGAAVDFTKPIAKEWFLTRLKDFQKKYNIDSFKFDAGSVSYLPFMYKLNSTNIPSNYSVAYATLASEINNMVEVRVGDNSQDLSVFVRFLDRDASWPSAMGLQSVIPTVLTFGILGYPFILPDMIGGNGSPDKELFIRWLQLNVFLPAMQFSHVPWDYDNETLYIAHNAIKIRETIFTTLQAGVLNVLKTGEPIIRPLWWVAPEDPVALKINQQFMVTDEYLVAPITQPGVSKINVYLPRGKWMEQFGDMAVHTVNEGASVSYNVTLSSVLYFKNVTNSFN